MNRKLLPVFCAMALTTGSWVVAGAQSNVTIAQVEPNGSLNSKLHAKPGQTIRIRIISKMPGTSPMRCQAGCHDKSDLFWWRVKVVGDASVSVKNGTVTGVYDHLYQAVDRANFKNLKYKVVIITPGMPDHWTTEIPISMD